MAETNEEGGRSEGSGSGDRAGGLGDGVVDRAQFDASLYEFFGDSLVNEFELVGLEDDNGDDGPSFVAFDKDENQISCPGDTVEGVDIGSLADIDDLTSILSKLSKDFFEPRSTGVISDRGSFSMESSSTADSVQDPEVSKCQDQHILDSENVEDGKRWWPHPHPHAGDFADPRLLYGTSSPQQQRQIEPTAPMNLGKSSHTSLSPPGAPSQFYPSHSHHGILTSPASSLQMPFFPPNPCPFSQLHLSAVQHGSNYDGNMTQFVPPGFSSNSRQQNRCSEQPGLLSQDNSNSLSDVNQHQWPHLNNPILSQLPIQQQQHGFHQFLPSMSHFPHIQSQLFNPNHFRPQKMNKFQAMHWTGEFWDQRRRQTYKGRHNCQFSQQSFDIGSQNIDNRWPRFHSKYMTTKELENISRMQRAATRSKDPYKHDYYHQACLAKRSAGSSQKHHFCPSVTKDLSPRAWSKHNPPSYLQGNALGRFIFYSIHRTGPLLEVESQSASADNVHDQKSSVNPLEQEPMLAARIIIEDGFHLLLDVDDIDRLLQFSQRQDGGSQLRKKREILLQELAALLRLVDPLDPGTSGHSGVAAKDVLVFLDIVSLPKGRKLLSRCLQLLMPGSELTRVICMAIFCHLRFLFVGLPSDFSDAESTTNLVKTISLCIHGMDLSALSACLAAVICSSEQPPFRPLGSSAGDGASIVIICVLDRATQLLTDHNTAGNCSIPSRNLWQASFDAFFGLLTEYCFSKYDSVMHSLQMQAPNATISGSEVISAMRREIPVELLRASLPHTYEHQRKLLFDFAQRTISYTGHNTHGGSIVPKTSQ